MKNVLLLIALFLAIINFSSVGFLEHSSADMMPMTQLIEMVNIDVNCTTASVNVTVVVASNVTSLIHFPEGAALNDPNLINATGITLGFTGDFSVLMFTFENVSASTAETYADDVKPSIESAFQTQFTYNSTEIHDNSVSVVYKADGKSDLVSYADWLMDQCLNSTIGGFSSAFLGMVSEPTAMVNAICYKEIGGFDWVYGMVVHYTTSISTGTGSHTVDVLDLLNVASLGPSQYALFEEFGYVSMVNVAVNSNETITFVGCVPPETSYPMSRGWYVPSDSGLTLTGTFYFGSDPTPVEELTFTFGGAVIPEINSLLLLVALLAVATLAIILKSKK
ncbi:hypothetical protein DRO54_01520 [Candidatus Bathyarchaeota archaeon]|nr:MAG: hypothetical protein DRO54_01520 [Candidatus Bathyarchaeota archaeon]